MPPSPPTTSNDRDSDGVRASIFDACLQLGALDENGVIAEWMFNEPLADPLSPTYRRGGRRFPGTRFQEVLTPVDENSVAEEEEEEEGQRPWRFPFSLFSSRTRHKGKRGTGKSGGTEKHGSDDSDGIGSEPARAEGGQATSTTRERASFFRRRRKSEMIDRSQRSSRTTTTASSRHDSGYASVRSKSRTPGTESDVGDASDGPQAPPLSIAASGSRSRSAEPLPSEGEDEEWQEIEVTPGSPLYALNNRGINPPSVYGAPDPALESRRNTHSLLPPFNRLTFRSSTPVPPSPSPPPSEGRKRNPSRLSKSPPASPPARHSKNHKQLGVRTESPSPSEPPRPGHGHTRSVSLPTSPFVPFPSGSPNNNAAPIYASNSRSNSPNGNGMANSSPKQASHVVFADNVGVPVSRDEVQTTYRESMGYHNQFFVRPAAKSLESAQVGSLPVKGKGKFLGIKKG